MFMRRVRGQFGPRCLSVGGCESDRGGGGSTEGWGRCSCGGWNYLCVCVCVYVLSCCRQQAPAGPPWGCIYARPWDGLVSLRAVGRLYSKGRRYWAVTCSLVERAAGPRCVGAGRSEKYRGPALGASGVCTSGEHDPTRLLVFLATRGRCRGRIARNLRAP